MITLIWYLAMDGLIQVDLIRPNFSKIDTTPSSFLSSVHARHVWLTITAHHPGEMNLTQSLDQFRSIDLNRSRLLYKRCSSLVSRSISFFFLYYFLQIILLLVYFLSQQKHSLLSPLMGSKWSSLSCKKFPQTPLCFSPSSVSLSFSLFRFTAGF
jgi:hypothetical protein